jgi:ADP-ribose pyrophosphatase YjhB (NUDIX family)
MKIYIGDTPLYLCADAKALGIDLTLKSVLVSRYTSKIKHLLNHIDLLEKSKKYTAVILEYHEPDVLVGDFFNLYKLRPAAGGLVVNELGQYLMILRLGYWDLPKGKIEKQEGIKVAAVREIEEETGAQDVKVLSRLLTTYHTYKIKKKRFLKQTYWFHCTAPKQQLTPQSEENIEFATWVDYSQFDETSEPIYKNILEVIETYQKQIA